MSKNKSRFYIGACACLIAYLIIAFAVPFIRNSCFWVSFVFGAIAILIQFYSLPKSMEGEELRSKFYGFPILKLSLIYLVCQLVLSVIFMAIAIWVPGWIPAVIFSVMLCAAVIGFVSSDAMREEVEIVDSQLKQDVSTIRHLQAKVNTLGAQCSSKNAEKAVTEFAEQMRFSDPVSSTAIADVETKLSMCIDVIAEAVLDDNEKDIIDACRMASVVLNERNSLCKSNK